MTDKTSPGVALFITCLTDTMRPSIGFAAVRLLEDAGCHVRAPRGQTCCGQPAYNAGDPARARAVARTTIEAFSDNENEYVVAPSGSCAATVKRHYPALFAEDPVWRKRAESFAARTFELTAFLTDVLGVSAVSGAAWDGVATYHDSCSGLRDLGVRDQPRRLLSSVAGLTLIEAEEAEACCGFGGMFSIKYADISERIVDAKITHLEATGATMVLGGDLGCLMNIAGRLARRGSPLEVRHVAEVLAGDTATPAIGAPPGRASPGGRRA
ncbi:(Fe-S)-binding protein [Varunaivibrio sulfuroxidans]|uniref:L-lactate dehydrogenase complex protein LldE n=1 Tax=Varunaivibrio sulfuroxidans TaxID=1773489 RepID=A0A4R3JHY6_9PROT|nr:(Fe-S)-binding protein [Varunaivibrio sulfuroxidans]TCS64876.1 L-lactate dehydrogenase complex protein LldE [Varunaivibrio sulfuroxidans]WES29827.1 (Fe-S)-binding protein [Varunaivibrio sulfuroxidans]